MSLYLTPEITVEELRAAVKVGVTGVRRAYGSALCLIANAIPISSNVANPMEYRSPIPEGRRRHWRG